MNVIIGVFSKRRGERVIKVLIIVKKSNFGIPKAHPKYCIDEWEFGGLSAGFRVAVEPSAGDRRL